MRSATSPKNFSLSLGTEIKTDEVLPLNYESERSMKPKLKLLRTVSTGIFLTLIVLTCFMPAQAQTVIPQVCLQPNHQTTTATLPAVVSGGATSLNINLTSDWASLIINPGGATEERFPVVRKVGSGTTLLLGPLAYAHSAGETVLATTEFDAVFGYTNMSDVSVTMFRGVSSHNFFAPGNIVYAQQINQFLPGIHGNAFTIKFGSEIPAGFYWFLGTTQLFVTNDTPHCSTITYQGRLSDAGTSANGNYDLQFVAYDAATNGTAQTDRITVNNVAVTNGIFTVPLFFSHTFTNSIKARFFEIGVRPGGSADAFTILAPRQPITDVPFAINAQTAINATNATNAVQLGGVAANLYVKNNGSGTINGDLQATGDVGVGKNLIVTGTISSSCRTGFTAFAGGRLCVSAMQPAALFYTANGAIQTCKNMKARVGGSADVMLTFSDSAFNYFDGVTQGWLADHFGENSWGTWLTPTVTPDFDGPALNVHAGASLPYRCVY